MSNSKDTTKPQFTLKNIKKLYQYAKPYQRFFILGLVALLFSSIAVMLFPHLLTKLIDSVLTENGQLKQQKVLTGLLILVLLQGFFSFLRIFLFAQVTERAVADLRVAVFKKIVSLEIPFFERRRVGELISRITNDISTLQDIFSLTLAEFIRQIVTLIVGIIMLLLISVKLTVTMLIVLPLFIFVAIGFGRFIRKISRKVQDELANASIVVEETFQNINVVKAFNNEQHETTKYQNKNTTVVDLALYAAKYRAAFVSFIILGLMLTIILMLYQGVNLVDVNADTLEKGRLTVGKLTEFILYTAFLGGALGGLGDTYAKIQKTLGSSERLVEILDKADEVEIKKGQEKVNLTGRIKFSNLNFSYPSRPDVQVLNDINLDISPGQRIAFVGHSGAGKSTIIQLLLKYYKASSGQIYIDDHLIDDLLPEQIRDNIAIVPQDVMLFGGTIRDNIAYGKLNATEEEVIEAAKKANAWNFIKDFPEGLESLVGERGVKLSGGQKQRIAIARAIIKNPSILILDEATSSLDAVSENLIKEALEEFMPGRTTLIIAHRLSTIKNVDQIVVLNQGNIIEKGNHTALINIPNGIYNNLLKLQLQDA